MFDLGPEHWNFFKVFQAIICNLWFKEIVCVINISEIFNLNSVVFTNFPPFMLINGNTFIDWKITQMTF